jgi:hypothetical protein
MKNIILTALLVFSILLTSFTTNISGIKPVKKNSLTQKGLKGKVKSLTETEYKASVINGKNTTGEILKRKIFIFNNSGYLTEENKLGENGKMEPSCLIKYDNNNMEVEKSDFHNGKMLMSLKSVYNAESVLIESTSYDSQNKPSMTYKYKYDNNGNKIQWDSYNSDGKLFRNHIYKYDENGNNTEHITYNKSGKQEEKLVYKYDNNSRTIEYCSYGPDKLKYRTTYKRDDKGNCIEMVNYNGNDISIKKFMTYDSNGYLAEEKSDNADGSFYSKYSYKYAVNGFLSGFTTYKSDGSVEKTEIWQYEYDKTENWIKQIKYLNSKVESITIREIIYY